VSDGLVADGTPRRVTRRRAETRDRLLAAALDVFAERGIGATTVEQVCDRAGYTRGAFYSNFTTVEELFFALYEQRAALVLERTRKALLAVRDAAGEAGDPVENAVETFLANVSYDRAWWLVTTEYLLHAARHPDAAARLSAVRKQVREQFVEVATAALKRVGRTPAISADDLVRILIALHEGGLLQSYGEPDSAGYDRLERLAFPNLIRGLTTEIELSVPAESGF
jgi:AcrR family transcriptional regulator